MLFLGNSTLFAVAKQHGLKPWLHAPMDWDVSVLGPCHDISIISTLFGQLGDAVSSACGLGIALKRFRARKRTQRFLGSEENSKDAECSGQQR